MLLKLMIELLSFIYPLVYVFSFYIHICIVFIFFFFFSSRRRHTRSKRDWSSDVCSSDLLYCLLNFCTGTNEKRDAITYSETQFLPQPLDAAHQLTSQTLEPQFMRYDRIERGKISGFLLYHHVARSASNDGQIFGTQLPRFISDRDEQRLTGFEISQRFAAQCLNGLGRERCILAELLTQGTEIRPSL